jgi:hypothetical protein
MNSSLEAEKAALRSIGAYDRLVRRAQGLNTNYAPLFALECSPNSTCRTGSRVTFKPSVARWWDKQFRILWDDPRKLTTSIDDEGNLRVYFSHTSRIHVAVYHTLNGLLSDWQALLRELGL